MPVVETVADVSRLSRGPGTAILGGGTLVMRQVNYGAAGIERIVRVTDPAWREIRTDGGRVRIGAGATMAMLAANRDTAALAPAASVVGGPAIRNMATVGGNLFAPHPYGDLAAMLLALDAQVVFAGGRTEGIEAFLGRRDGERDVVVAVTVPRVEARATAFRKVSRTKPKGVSLMSIAAWLPRDGGRLGQVRIAFGAMGPAPVRAKGAEAALTGQPLDERTIARAADAACEGLSPPDDPLASAWYRREVAPVHLRRLLEGMR